MAKHEIESLALVGKFSDGKVRQLLVNQDLLRLTVSAMPGIVVDMKSELSLDIFPAKIDEQTKSLVPSEV